MSSARGNEKPSAITPITVVGVPSIRIFVPKGEVIAGSFPVTALPESRRSGSRRAGRPVLRPTQ